MATDQEKAVDAAWTLGRLYAFLNPSQKKIYDKYHESSKDTNTKFVVNCSRKIGKSVLGLFIAVECAIQTKNALIAFIAPTVDDVQKYTRQLYQVVFATCPENLKPRLMKTEIVFANGSRILFRGVGKGIGSSYNNLRSFAFDLAILDEAAFSANLDEIIDSVLTPTLLPRNGKALMLSTPPITPDHVFKDYCEQAKSAGRYMELTIRDSHYPLAQQEQFIREMGGLQSAKVQREFFCKWIIDAEFQIIPEWDEKYCRPVEKDKNWKYWHKYESLDPGWTDFSVCLFGWYNWSKKIVYVKGEIMMKSPQQTTDLLAEAIIAKEKEIFGDAELRKRIADNNTPSTLQDFNLRHKLYFSPVESKTRLDVMVSDVREVVKDGRLMVDPACTQLLGCLRNGVFTKTKSGQRGKEFARSKTFGHYDAIAALVYWIRELDQNTNPLPPMADKDEENTFVPKQMADAVKGKTGEIIGAGMDEAMNQNFNYQEHDSESYD